MTDGFSTGSWIDTGCHYALIISCILIQQLGLHKQSEFEFQGNSLRHVDTFFFFFFLHEAMEYKTLEF